MDNEGHTERPVPAPYQGEYEIQQPGGYGAYPSYGYYGDTAYGYGGPAEGPNWRRLLGELWAKKWWILIPTVVATVVGSFIVRDLVKPVYVARASIWYDVSELMRGPIEAQDLLEGAGWADLLRSRAVLVPVAQELNLAVDVMEPEGAGMNLMRDLEVTDRAVTGEYLLTLDPGGTYELRHEERGVLESGQLGTAIGTRAGFRWEPDAAALADLSQIRFRLRTEIGAARSLRSLIESRYDPNSSLIHTSFTWDDPVEAAEILNQILVHFVETATDLKNRKLEEVVDILEQQTGYAAEDLRNKELSLEDFRVRTVTEPTDRLASPIPGGQQTRGTVFGTYFEQRVESRQLDFEIQQIEEILRDLNNGGELNTLAVQQVPSTNDSPALTRALSSLLDKEAERRALLNTYTEEHPTVVRLTNEIEILESQTIPGLLAALANQLSNRRGLLDEQLQAQAGELRQIPPRTIEDTRRERDYQLAEDLHNRLLGRLRESRLALATSLPDMHIVEEATPPYEPAENEAPRFILMIAMASFGLAVGGVVLANHLDKRIKYPEQVTGKLGLPVLGIVPRLTGSKNGQSPMLAAVAIESFRSIRTQIAHAGLEEARTVLITSPAPRDGKSMVAANLAISYASSGRRAVFLDADTRRGKAQEMFGLERSPGLTEYLRGDAELEEILKETEVPGLLMIPCGEPRGFNHELLASGRMRELVDYLEETFDSVVLDAPPLAAGADPLVLGKLADKVVLVLRAGQTDHEMARAKLEMVGNVELPFVGAILNAVPETADYYTYYANSYYYADSSTSA